MSKVISFRLDEDNPREARALAVLKARCAQGHRARNVITEALIRLDEATNNSGTKDDDESLATIASQVNHLVDMIKAGNNIPIGPKNDGGTRPELTGNFLDSIKLAAKPGLKLD